MTNQHQIDTLKLSGSLTLRNADEVRSALLQALQESAAVEIECDEEAEADITFFQLIVAASRTASARGKPLMLAASARDKLRDAAQRAGLADVTRHDDAGHSIWFRESATA